MEASRKSYDVIAMGRSSIDLYSNDIGAPFEEITSFAAYVGGCPTNISVGTRRLGLHPALLTAVGDDQVGNFILHFLRSEGIETQFIPRKPGHRSSAVVLDIDYRPDQWNDQRAFGVTLRSVLRLVNIVIGTEDEINAAMLTDINMISIAHSQVSDPRVRGDTDAAIQQLLKLGPHVLVQKRGALGSRVHL